AHVLVAVTPAVHAGTDSSIALCSIDGAISLVDQLGGTASEGGTWTGPVGAASASFHPSSDVPGAYTYTVSGTAPCPDASATVTITVNPMPTAGLDGSIQMCPTADAIALFPVLGGTPDPGGTWTAPGGLVHGDLFDPATDAPGVYTYTVLGSAPCPGDMATATVQVFLVPAPEAGNNSISCTLGETLSATGTWSTGQWSGPAGTLLAHPDSATTTVSAISAGAYVFIWGTVSAEGCASSDSVQVTFTDPILPTVTATERICHGSCDGGAVVTATGGNVLDGAYAFQWSGGMGGNSATAAG